ncbi:F-box domain containing protein [Tanacetum coccineum]
MKRYDQTFKCTCEKGDVVLRTSRKPYSYGRQYYACPCSKPGTQDRGCGYFMWMNDLRLYLSSSSGPSTPPSSYLGPSKRPIYSSGTSGSALNLGKAECSNWLRRWKMAHEQPCSRMCHYQLSIDFVKKIIRNLQYHKKKVHNTTTEFFLQTMTG